MDIQQLFAKNSLVAKLFIVIGFLVCVWYWRMPLFEALRMVGNRDAIVAYLEQYHAWGPIILFLILGAQVFLAVIPGHAFIVAGGYVYGFVIGALVTQISTVLASQLAYLLARKARRPFVDRMAPAQVIDKWNRLAEEQGALFFFFSFILPIFPSDLMCFIAGLSSVQPKKFFAANFLGRLPCAIFITLIGSHGFEMPIQFWIVMALLVVGLCAFWKRISKLLEQRLAAALHIAGC